MSSFLSTLVTDIRAAIATTWTDVKANGIWEAEQLDMIPWEDTTVPFAFFILGQAQSTDEYAADSACYIVNATIGYVGETAGGSSTQRSKVEALRDALFTSGLAHGQILDVTSTEYDDNVEPNKYFAQKDYTHRAAILSAECLVGDVYGT